MNLFALSGRVATEPKYRKAGEVPVVRFRLANSTYTSRGEKSTFVTCEIWGPAADKFRDKFKKGSPIYVDGFIETDEWTDRDGNKRSDLLFHVKHHEREMVQGGRPPSNPPEEAEAVGAASRGRGAGDDEVARLDERDVGDDSDIPF